MAKQPAAAITEPTATVEDGVLTIKMPLDKDGRLSASQKTNTHGYFRTDPRSSSCPKFNGKPLTVQVTAGTKV